MRLFGWRIGLTAAVVVVSLAGGKDAWGQIGMTPLGAPESIFSGQESVVTDPMLRSRLALDFRRQVRMLDSSIKLVQAEVDSWKRRLGEYSHFQKFVHSDPFIHEREYCQLKLIDAELRLKMLKRDRLDVLRYQSELARGAGAEPLPPPAR